jgi:hypothetical protein
MKRRFLPSSMLALSLLVLASCGGSSGTSEEGVANLGEVSGTFNAIEGLLFDGSSGSARLGVHAIAAPPPSDFSPSACRYIADRQILFENFDRVRGPLCHLAEAEKGVPEFVIPEETWGYFEVLNPGGSKGVSGEGRFLLRLGKFTVDGQVCLRMQQCEDSTFREDFTICRTADGVRATQWHKFRDKLATGAFTGEGSLDLTVHADADGAPTAFEMATAHTWGDGAHSCEFTADKEKQLNTYVGHHHFSRTEDAGTFENEGGLCVYAGGGAGSAKGNETSTFPIDLGGVGSGCPSFATETTGECTATWTLTGEAFTYDVGPPPVFTLAETSPFDDLLADCEIPTDTAAPTRPDEEWTCEAPDGFTDVDVGEIDFSDCERPHKEFLNCEELRRQAEPAPL